MEKLTIYDRKGAYRYARQFLDRLKIPHTQKAKILEFDDFLETEQNLSILRRAKYLRLLGKCGEFLGIAFEQAEKEDIIRVVKKINGHPTWAESTKRDHKVFLKRFYKWLQGDEEEYPRIVKWIKTSGKDPATVQPADLLTPDEIRRILAVASCGRDKAFIHVLAESGCRIGEIGTLRRKDVSFDTYGALIHVHGKTGERPVRLVKAVSDLHYWLLHHPEKTPDAPLWPVFTDPSDCLCYAAFVKILRKHFKLAKIEKKHNPHMFRHYRLTELSKHLSDQQLKVYAGWSKNSKMIETYSHITGGDVANRIIELHGLKKEENRAREETFCCPRCHAPNSRASQFCYNCNHVLNDLAAMSIGKIESELAAQFEGNDEAKLLLGRLLDVLKKSSSSRS